MTKPVVGLSACLVGLPVRYDGGHKDQSWLHGEVLPWIEPFTVCPEAGSGLGVPRPPVRLVSTPFGLRMVGVEDPTWNVTERVERYTTLLLDSMPAVDGFIVKARSPSCASRDAPWEMASGAAMAGSGLFTRRLRLRLPLLPIDDEETLSSTDLRQSYFDRVFLYRAGRHARDAGSIQVRLGFLDVAESVLGLRDLAPEWVELPGQIMRLRENPLVDDWSSLVESIFRAAVAPRSRCKAQKWLTTHANLRDISAPERALRFGL